MNAIIKLLERYKRKKTIEFLKGADPEKIEAFGRKCLLSAFKRAATRVPAYKKILSEHNLDYKSITTADLFKSKVPVIDKKSTFSRFDIEELCVDGTIKDMKLAMSSSGFSGDFSFGINTETNQKNIAKSIDTAMNYVFGIDSKKTFLVNCIPMGVKVSTSLKLSENSVRSDMAIAIIKKFSHKFEQTIIVSDPNFLKKLVEDANQAHLDWKKLNISLVFGEDWFSESFRSYLANLMDINLEKEGQRTIAATMGIAELDLNLFHESFYTIQIRRRLQNNPQLKKDLFGDANIPAPIIFHYYPHKLFLEALPEDSNEKELVFSMLSRQMLIPLLRYNSRDRGWIFPYNKIKDVLIRNTCADIIPDLKLPCVGVGGRVERFLLANGNTRVYPEEIKQGLYEDFEAAAKTTGYFFLNPADGGRLEVQLKEGIFVSEELKHKFENCCFRYTKTSLPLILYSYRDFPHGMVLDYERKFKHI
jgi:phenylacetate-CoA ligase